jgi:Arc/MetJ-type ribon-helix-helix transcriptional regulator|tara:strand:+ start:979 stop:1221 length:243 start_codon:yes stop_codon:yes gene_type:complete
MGSPHMTSISVSFEVRRQLNSMRALGNYKSVDDLLQHLLKEYRLNQISRDSDALQQALGSINDIDVNGLIAKLDLSPFQE